MSPEIMDASTSCIHSDFFYGILALDFAEKRQVRSVVNPSVFKRVQVFSSQYNFLSPIATSLL